MAFIIYSLPLSRTAWLTHYLNYPLARPPQVVSHDTAPLCGNVKDFVKAYKDGLWGSVELAGVIGWQVIREELPNLKTVVVRRPVQDVYSSIVKLNLEPDLDKLIEVNEILDVVAAQPGVHSVAFGALDTPAMCKWLFEYCLELEFDFDWWQHVAALNIQIDIEAFMRNKSVFDTKHSAYRTDVLERMKGVASCLN